MDEETTCYLCDGVGSIPTETHKGQQFVDINCEICGGTGILYKGDC